MPRDERRLVLIRALGDTCRAAVDEFARVPSVHWNESVFRFLLVRNLLAKSRNLKCHSEWNRVDLVILGADGATLVELKFYASQPLLDHQGRLVRYKGGPSRQNVAEFLSSIGRLRAARSRSWAMQTGSVTDAYVVLAYLDPMMADGRRTFASYYDAMPPPTNTDRWLSPLMHNEPTSDGKLFTCRLLQVGLEPAA